MGKPKERPKKTLRKPDEVATAKPLVDKLAKAKTRLGKVKEKIGADASKSDPRHRAARKRVKRAQRRHIAGFWRPASQASPHWSSCCSSSGC